MQHRIPIRDDIIFGVLGHDFRRCMTGNRGMNSGHQVSNMALGAKIRSLLVLEGWEKDPRAIGFLLGALALRDYFLTSSYSVVS